MGRYWLHHIHLDWQSIHLLEAASITSLQTVLSNHTSVFADELGCAKGVNAKIYVDPEARPRFCKPKTVPFVFRKKVNKELECLKKTGVIEPVQHADWAVPIVPVLKQNGLVRICGNYKLTVNQAVRTDSFPLPRIYDLFCFSGWRTSIFKARFSPCIPTIGIG